MVFEAGFDPIEVAASCLCFLSILGEALNSMCNLSDRVTVVTRTIKDELGESLSFDRTGSLSRQVGFQGLVFSSVDVADLTSHAKLARK